MTGEKLIRARERIARAYLSSSFDLPPLDEPRIKELMMIEETLNNIVKFVPSDVDIAAAVVTLLEAWAAENAGTVTQCVGALEIAKKVLLEPVERRAGEERW